MNFSIIDEAVQAFAAYFSNAAMGTIQRGVDEVLNLLSRHPGTAREAADLRRNPHDEARQVALNQAMQRTSQGDPNFLPAIQRAIDQSRHTTMTRSPSASSQYAHRDISGHTAVGGSTLQVATGKKNHIGDVIIHQVKHNRVAQIVGSLVIVAAIVTLTVALARPGSDSSSNVANQPAPIAFKDTGKTITGTVDPYNFQPFSNNPQSAQEAITLEQVIDHASGVNNVDIAIPGQRFVAVRLKVANPSNVPISILGDDLYQFVVLHGSDGQKYDALADKGTVDCPLFDSSSHAQLAPKRSVEGCLRASVPNSVDINQITYTFGYTPTPGSGQSTIDTATWTR